MKLKGIFLPHPLPLGWGTSLPHLRVERKIGISLYSELRMMKASRNNAVNMHFSLKNTACSDFRLFLQE